jgi:hypothetical protein
LGKRRHEYGLQINVEKTVILRLLRMEEKNTIMKISGSNIKEVDRFIYLRSVVGKNSEIQHEINKKKGLKIYHLIKSILWIKDIENVKPRYTMCNLRRYYYVEWSLGHAVRKRKAKYRKQMKLFEGSNAKDKERESEMHTPEKSSEYSIYRTKSREIDQDGLDMSKEWMSTEYLNDYGT